jgi:hypothetical protein
MLAALRITDFVHNKKEIHEITSGAELLIRGEWKGTGDKKLVGPCLMMINEMCQI